MQPQTLADFVASMTALLGGLHAGALQRAAAELEAGGLIRADTIAELIAAGDDFSEGMRKARGIAALAAPGNPALGGLVRSATDYEWLVDDMLAALLPLADDRGAVMIQARLAGAAAKN